MTSAYSRAAAAREPDSAPLRHALAPAATPQAAFPNPTGATIQNLVAHSAIRGRGNRTVRAAAIQQMQRTSGNRAVQRLLAGRAAPVTVRRGPVSVQRNGTGLAGAGAVGQFATNMKAPMAAWDSYGDDLEKRQRALFEPATKQLEALGAPRITSLLKDDRLGDESTYAAFMPATWMVLINPAGLRANASDDAKARLAGTIYHEIRHAEQYYRIARMLAGKGAEKELSTLGLRKDVVEHARKNPLSPPQKSKQSKHGPTEQQREYQEAEAWYEASTRYGDMSRKLEETQKEYHAAKATKDTHPERYKAAWLQYRQAYKLYQSTAVEADAWAVGGMVESTLGFKPNTLETELAKMPADPRTFTPIGAPTSTPQPPMRPRAVATGAPPAYKPQPDNFSTSASPLTPPVRQARKLGGFSPLTPFDPNTFDATDTPVPGPDDSPAADTSDSPGSLNTAASPLMPPVRRGRNLGGFSPLTPLDPSAISVTGTPVPDLDDLTASISTGHSPGSITTSALPLMPPVRQGRNLGGFSPLKPLNPSTIPAEDTAVPDVTSSPSGAGITTPPVRMVPRSTPRPRPVGISPLAAFDPNTISASDTPDTTPTPDPTGGPRRDDDETNLQLTVQRHAMPEDLAQVLNHEQIPQEELTAKG